MNLSYMLLVGLGLLTVSSPAPSVEPAAPQMTCAALTWTQTDFGNDTWDGMKQQAANYTAEGFSDWRLPTIAEYQAAFTDGSFGQMTPNVNLWNLWTSKPQGYRAWVVKVATDANGDVIASQSGAAVLINKASFVHAKFVRP